MGYNFKFPNVLSCTACALLALLLFTASCSTHVPGDSLEEAVTAKPLTLTIAHVGDTDSYVIPHDVLLKFNGQETLVHAGGWSLMAAALEEIRRTERPVILLHSGDAAGGTIWSAKFNGAADFAAMNALNFDAIVLGDNDFSRGTRQAIDLVNTVQFPVLAANLDLGREPALAKRVKPYTLMEYYGQKVGIIGLITPDTEYTGHAGKTVSVLPEKDIARKYVAELRSQGINIIIVLSHLGYDRDTDLAKSVDGIDIIVGGHSQTLMGSEFKQLGLKSDLPYPVEMQGPSGQKVLIVHAWKNNQLLGQIKLNFDEYGMITDYAAKPFIPMTSSFKVEDASGWYHLCSCQALYGEIMQTVSQSPVIKLYWNNSDMDSVLQPYITKIEGELNGAVCTADENIIRSMNGGPGPLAANALLWNASKVNPDMQIAILDSDDVRADLFKGPILENDVQMLLPLRRNLVTATLKGSLLKMLLEAGIDSHIRLGMQPPYFYTAGLKMTVDISRIYGERITGLKARGTDGAYSDIDPDTAYTIVTLDYLVDKYVTALIERMVWARPFTGTIQSWVKDSINYKELGVKEIDAASGYFRAQKNISNIAEDRITILP